jgi:undecaprenyl pyrophosphate phosphatase UppP
VRRHDYTVFVVYRLALAVILALLIISGARDATF